MSDDDEDGDDDAAALEQLSELFDEEGKQLGKLLEDSEKEHPLFPATRAFLTLQGASHVMELSAEKRAELMAIWHAERANLSKPSN